MVENKILNVGRALLEIEARTRASYRRACGFFLAINADVNETEFISMSDALEYVTSRKTALVVVKCASLARREQRSRRGHFYHLSLN